MIPPEVTFQAATPLAAVALLDTLERRRPRFPVARRRRLYSGPCARWATIISWRPFPRKGGCCA